MPSGLCFHVSISLLDTVKCYANPLKDIVIQLIYLQAFVKSEGADLANVSWPIVKDKNVGAGWAGEDCMAVTA